MVFDCDKNICDRVLETFVVCTIFLCYFVTEYIFILNRYLSMGNKSEYINELSYKFLLCHDKFYYLSCEREQFKITRVDL